MLLSCTDESTQAACSVAVASSASPGCVPLVTMMFMPFDAAKNSSSGLSPTRQRAFAPALAALLLNWSKLPSPTTTRPIGASANSSPERTLRPSRPISLASVTGFVSCAVSGGSRTVPARDLVSTSRSSSARFMAL